MTVVLRRSKFLDLGDHLVGEGCVQVGITLADDFRRPSLMGGVEVREQEADRQRLGSLVDQVVQVLDQGSLVEGVAPPSRWRGCAQGTPARR